ncbi:hypothetical protein ACI2IP_00660 [Microbacterium sp. NPDC090218]
MFATPQGPLTTLGRNVASVGAAFFGIFCIALPSLLGVPVWSALIFALVGAAMIGVFTFHLFRWRQVSRAAKREAASMGALAAAAFMQAKILQEGSGRTEHLGPGWLLVFEDRVFIRLRHGGGTYGKQRDPEEIALRDVARVLRTEETSMEYAELVVALSAGAKYAFVFVPSDGSGWHGPTEEEVEGIQHRIQRLLDLRN